MVGSATIIRRRQWLGGWEENHKMKVMVGTLQQQEDHDDDNQKDEKRITRWRWSSREIVTTRKLRHENDQEEDDKMNVMIGTL
jgi:hypothetical protein